MDYKFDPLNFISKNDDPELQDIMDSLYAAYDRLMIYLIKKETGNEVKIIDDEHISVNGEVMNNDEFEVWLEDNYPANQEYDSETKYYDA